MKMNKVISFDIETKNLSYEIGGWENQHLFKVACITTWDGDNAVIYSDEKLSGVLTKSENTVIKTLREFKFDIDDHLPVLRDSMDIYIVRKYLEDKSNRCIDTSAYMTKHHGKRIHLDNLVKCTLDDSKSMSGIDSVIKWRQGEFDEVAEYCLKDSRLTYDLWKYGQEHGIVKYYDEVKDEHIEAKVEW